MHLDSTVDLKSEKAEILLGAARKVLYEEVLLRGDVKGNAVATRRESTPACLPGSFGSIICEALPSCRD